MGFFSCAQEDKNWILDQKDSSSKTEIASKENFYDALRFRTDLKLILIKEFYLHPLKILKSLNKNINKQI